VRGGRIREWGLSEKLKPLPYNLKNCYYPDNSIGKKRSFAGTPPTSVAGPGGEVLGWVEVEGAKRQPTMIRIVEIGETMRKFVPASVIFLLSPTKPVRGGTNTAVEEEIKGRGNALVKYLRSG